MTLTTQQQTSILQLSHVMFDMTPGAVFLDMLGTPLETGKSLADLAQFLSGTNLFFGHTYNDNYMFHSSFANNFVNDLVGDHTSIENKTRAVNYIIEKMANGGTQAKVVAELIHTLSAVPASDPEWGVAAKYHNTRMAMKVITRLAGNSISAEEAEFAVDHMLALMTAGQNFGAVIAWAISALDNIDHSNSIWGEAAALFDNRTAVSRYYSIDKIGPAIGLITKQYLLSQMEAGDTFTLLWRQYITLLSNETNTIPDSARSSIVLGSILAEVTEDPDSVIIAKNSIDNFLKSSYNLYSLNGSNGFRINDAIALDYTDYIVSGAGDFNGDGYDDVIVGADYHGSDNPVSDTAYIVFGSAKEFNAILNLSSIDGSNGFRINGISEMNDKFMIKNAGDINADGLDDIVVGAYNNDDSASVYVLFGKTDGSEISPTLSNLNGSNGFRIDGISVYDDLSVTVNRAGDFNGDGYDDLIIGSPFVSSSFLIYGKDSRFDAVLNLHNLDVDKGFRLDGATTGNAVSAAGDVNGDGYDDLIIGASEADSNGSNASLGYIVFGQSSKSNGVLDLTRLDGINGFRLIGEAKTGSIGYSVSSAGDVNGDGLDDLIIGASNANLNGNFSGSSFVLFGKTSGFNEVIDLSNLDGTNGFRLDGEREAHAGSSVSGAGDFNGDGFDDLIVGAYAADPDGFRVGANYLVYGQASGFSATLTLSNLNGNSGMVLKGLLPNYRLGNFISHAGDVNGDGFDDLVMGVSKDNLNDNILNLGSSYVVFGGNITSAVTFMGASGTDHLTEGTPKAENFVAGDGNDLMIGGGGLDAFHGGAGDDTIKISQLDFRLVDGGTGDDTMALIGSGLNLDLAVLSGKIDGIETIDLTGNGNNTLRVQLPNLLKLSDTSNILKVNGNIGDSITGLNSGWTDGGIIGDYHTYVQDAAVLLVGVNIATDYF